MTAARCEKALDGASAWLAFLVLLVFWNLRFKNEVLWVLAN